MTSRLSAAVLKAVSGSILCPEYSVNLVNIRNLMCTYTVLMLHFGRFDLTDVQMSENALLCCFSVFVEQKQDSL